MSILCVLDFYDVTQGAMASPYFDNMAGAFIDNCIISWISVKFKHIDMLLRLISIDDIYSNLLEKLFNGCALTRIRVH